MEIINNKFRIMKLLQDNGVLSSYLVIDITNDKQFVLNMIKDECDTQRFSGYFMKNSRLMKKIDTENIIKINEIGIVDTIDNEKLECKYYFFLCEYVDSGDLFYNLNILKDEEIIPMFMELCKSINYLHLKGIAYKNISYENMELTYVNSEPRIMLKDLMLSNLKEEMKLSLNKENKTYYSELLKNTDDIGYDIYCLGLLLLSLITKEFDRHKLIKIIKRNSDDLPNLESGYNCLFLKLRNIIIKMVRLSDNNYESLSEVVKDINLALNTNYNCFRMEELGKLSFNDIDLVGRVKYIEKITDLYNKFKDGKSNQNICLISGEDGIGKSSFLTYLSKYLSIKGENVYDIIHKLNFKQNHVNNNFSIILSKIISDTPKEILDKYEEDLSQLLPKISSKKDLEVRVFEEIDIKKIKLANRVGNFIVEFSKRAPIIIIIDDIDQISEFQINILNYILDIDRSNIFFIFSYCDQHSTNNQFFIKCIEKIKRLYNPYNLRLNGLTVREVGSLVREILFIQNEPLKLASKIHEKSGGNPLFVEEILRDLYLRRVIFVDDNGNWTQECATEDMMIPSNMRQVLFNQLTKVSTEERKFLEFICLFQDGVREKVLYDLFPSRDINIGYIIESLVDKGVIYTNNLEKELVIDFYNKLLKIIVYESISPEDKINEHRRISEYLRYKYEGKECDLIPEIIYQLEKCKRRSDVAKYSIINIRNNSSIKDRVESVYYLNRALNLYENTETDEDKINLYIALGNLYFDYEDIEEAEKYFKFALQDCIKVKESSKYIEVFNSLNGIYVIKDDTINLKKALDIIEAHVDMHGDRKDKLQFYYKKAIYYSYISQGEKAIDLCNKVLEQCDNRDYDLMCHIYNFLGYVHLELSDISTSIKYLMKCIKLCKKVDNLNVLLKSYINLGVAYGDFLQDFKNSIIYYRKSEVISIRKGLSLSKIRIKNNCASSYLLMEDYKKTRKELDEIINIVYQKGYINEISYWHQINMILNLKLNKFDEAYKSYFEVENVLNKNRKELSDRSMAERYLYLSQFNICLGNIEDAKIYMDEALKLTENESSIISLLVYLNSQYIKILQKEDIKDSIDNILNIIKKLKNKEMKINTICNTAQILLISEYEEELERFLQENYSLLGDSNNIDIVLKTKVLFIKSLFNYPLDKKIIKLEGVLELSKNNGLNEIYYKTAIMLGELYLNSGDYVNSIVYYFLACETFRDLLIDLPEKYRETYIKLHKLEEVYGVFIELKGMYLFNTEESNYAIREIFKEDGFIHHMDILENKDLMKAIKKAYSPFYSKKVENINDTLSLLQGDNYENIRMLNKYILYEALAKKSYIIMNKHKDYEILAATDDITKVSDKMRGILDKVKVSRKEEVIYNKSYITICKPILISKYSEVNSLIEDRRKSERDRKVLLGYIYIETDKVVNYFTKENIKNSEYISKIMGIIIEKINLKENAFYDKLTGALTRKYLDICLNEIIDISATYKENFSIIMIDFDHFKAINDNFGHQVGDKVLTNASQIIRENIRSKDILGRYGGEELMVILPNSNKNQAYKIAEKLRKSIGESSIISSKSKVTVSIGIASYPYDGKTTDELIEKADKALYLAKKRGRNVTIVWDENLRNQVTKNNTLSGIVLKSFVKEEKHLFTIVELLELVRKDGNSRNKILTFLEKILDASLAERAILFTVKENKVEKILESKSLNNVSMENIKYNKNLIDKAIKEGEGVYCIDWDYVYEYDEVTGNPDWKSVIVVPIMLCGEVIGVLNLIVSSKVKEFNFEEYNLCSLLSGIISPIITRSELD